MHPPRAFCRIYYSVGGVHALHEMELEQIFDALEVEVQAFAICEIGEHFSLQCDPHEDIVLHFVLQGEGYLECQYGRYQLVPGALAIIPQRLRKSLTGAGPIREVRPAEPTCFLRNEIVRFRATDCKSDLLLGCAVLKSSITHAVPLFRQLEIPIVTHTDDPATRGLFAALLNEVAKPRAGARAFLSAIMKQLLIVLLRADVGQNGPIMSDHLTKPQINRVAMMIRAKPGEAHSIFAMAARAGMSRSRFIAHFAKAYGCTPMAFVQSARLASAATLLRSSDLPVKAVAATVGYASRSQFSKVFQDKHGQSPSAFRRNSR